MVDLWDKLRRAWLAITARLIKSRKIGNGNHKTNNSGARITASDPNYGEAENGYLKLLNDVENCEYEDVHVLWNILSQMQGQEASVSAPSSSSSSSSSPSPSSSSTTNNNNQPHKHSWRNFFSSFNRQTATSFSLLS